MRAPPCRLISPNWRVHHPHRCWTNLGLNDGSSAGMINSYNQIVLERKKMLDVAATEISPVIEAYDVQLQNLKASIISSISNYRTSLQIQLNALNSQSGSFSSKIFDAPSYQRQGPKAPPHESSAQCRGPVISIATRRHGATGSGSVSRPSEPTLRERHHCNGGPGRCSNVS